MFEFEPDYGVAPGVMLLDVLDEQGSSLGEVAYRLGVPFEFVDLFVEGLVPLDAKLAISLERVTEVKAYMWVNMEAEYRNFLGL